MGLSAFTRQPHTGFIQMTYDNVDGMMEFTQKSSVTGEWGYFRSKEETIRLQTMQLFS